MPLLQAIGRGKRRKSTSDLWVVVGQSKHWVLVLETVACLLSWLDMPLSVVVRLGPTSNATNNQLVFASPWQQ